MGPARIVFPSKIFKSCLLLMVISLWPSQGHSWQAPSNDTRKIKLSIQPEYPPLARERNVRGIARVQVTVAPDGTVKDVKELGGHPLLLDALVRAVKKWKYEPADRTSVFEVRSSFGQ